MSEAIADPAEYGFESKEEALADARLQTMNEVLGVTMSAKQKVTMGEIGEYLQSWISQTDALGNVTQLLSGTGSGAEGGALVQRKFGEGMASPLNEMQQFAGARAKASRPYWQGTDMRGGQAGVVATIETRRNFFQNATEADWQKMFGKVYERNVEVMAEAIADPAEYGFESKEEALADARLQTMNEVLGIELSAKDKITSQYGPGGDYESASSWGKQVDALGNVTQVMVWMTGTGKDATSGEMLIQRQFSTAPKTAALNEMQKYRDAARTSAGGGGDTNVTVVAPTTANSTTTTQNINPNPLMSQNPRSAIGVGY